MKKETSAAAKSGETTIKSKTPVYVRVLAIVLVVFLAADIALVGISRVDYSTEEYTDSQTEDMAVYIQQNDEYLNAGFIQRMRNAVRSLGKPRSFEEYYIFASVAIADNDYGKAIGYLNTCVDMYSGDSSGLVSLLVKRGCLYALSGDWISAEDDFSAACEKAPDEAQVWLMLAKACYNTKDYEKGVKALSTYAEMADMGYDEYSILASMQFNGKDYAGAVDTCTKAMECENCDELEIYGIRAKANYLIENYTAAGDDARKCLELGGDYQENMTFAAACYEAEGKYESVLRILMDMIDNGIEDDSIYQSALTCAVSVGNYEAQEKVINLLLAYDHDDETDRTLRSTLAAAQIQMDEYEQAKENLEIILEKYPDDLNCTYLYGMCLMQSGEYWRAYDTFTKVIKGGALVEESHYNRAVCQIARGKKDDARAELNGIIQRNADADIAELARQLLEGM